MTAKAFSQTMNHDRRSALAVLIVTLVALSFGAIIKSAAENRSQHIERKGVTASVPDNWVIKEGAGTLIFVTWDPFVPGVRYSVSLESNDGGNRPLTEVAMERHIILGKVLETFRVLEETPIIRRSREGYKVTYAFVDTKVEGVPSVLKGVDYYFPAGDKIIIISLQAYEREYDESLLRFEAFLDSVSYKSGE
ncbi:MAG TPA: hypothetical protein VIS72_10140 [Anaerolineales bacterium]